MRIVGGSWRSRRIRFASTPELRPTPDRVRETLFNWLQGEVTGRRALDLYAGSGALGLEALSRGARAATLVERDARVVASLRATVAELGASGAHVVHADAFEFLRGPSTPYDLAFLDPPFGRGWLGASCRLLDAGGWLAPHAWIYLESARDEAPELPPGWTVRRHAQAGDVSARLARRGAGASSESSDEP